MDTTHSPPPTLALNDRSLSPSRWDAIHEEDEEQEGTHADKMVPVRYDRRRKSLPFHEIHQLSPVTGRQRRGRRPSVASDGDGQDSGRSRSPTTPMRRRSSLSTTTLIMDHKFDDGSQPMSILEINNNNNNLSRAMMSTKRRSSYRVGGQLGAMSAAENQAGDDKRLPGPIDQSRLLAPPRLGSKRVSLPFIAAPELGHRSPTAYREWKTNMAASASNTPRGSIAMAGRRRLSQVSKFLSARLSNLAATSDRMNDIVEQSRCVLTRLAWIRLREAKPELYRRAALRHLRGHYGAPGEMCARRHFRNHSAESTYLITHLVHCLLNEMTAAYPGLHVSILAQTGSHSPNGSKETAANAPLVVTHVAREIFRQDDPTWMHIVSLMGVATGVAADCVAIGHPEAVVPVLEAVVQFIDRDLASWIAIQGGWSKFVALLRSSTWTASWEAFKGRGRVLFVTATITFWVALTYYCLHR